MSIKLFPKVSLLEAQIRFEYDGLEGLAFLIRGGYQLSDDARDYIADAIEGKIKRPIGRSKLKNRSRDWRIASEIHELLKPDGSLRSSKKREGAAALVGEKYGIGQEAAVTIYQKFKATLKRYEEQARQDAEYFESDEYLECLEDYLKNETNLKNFIKNSV